jgi:hypothetical protein
MITRWVWHVRIIFKTVIEMNAFPRFYIDTVFVVQSVNMKYSLQTFFELQVGIRGWFCFLYVLLKCK